MSEIAKQCWACKEQLPDGAQKCRECGSYQGFRKHLDLSQITLALLIAFMAMFSTVPATVLSLRDFFRALSAPKIAARILEFEKNNLSIYVENNSGEELLISGANCLVYFPKDASKNWRDRLKKRDQSALDHNLIWPTQAESINQIVLTYRIKSNILGDSQAAIFQFELQSSFLLSHDQETNDPAPSICTIDLSKSEPMTDVEIVGLDVSLLSTYDLNGLLDEIKILESANTTREKIKSKLVNYRNGAPQNSE